MASAVSRRATGASIILVLTAILAVAPTPEAASAAVSPGYLAVTNAEIPAPPEGLFNYDVPLTVQSSQDTAPYFWGTSFRFRSAGSGWIGLQGNGTTPAGGTDRIAIFSIWGATGGSDGCAFEAGPSSPMVCRLPFEWADSRPYVLRLWEVDTGDAHPAGRTEQWGAWVIDPATGAETNIGIIDVPADSGWLDGTLVHFTQHFGAVETCGDLPPVSVTFGQTTGNAGELGAAGHQSHTQGACAATATATCAGTVCTHAVGAARTCRNIITRGAQPREIVPSTTRSGARGAARNLPVLGDIAAGPPQFHFTPGRSRAHPLQYRVEVSASFDDEHFGDFTIGRSGWTTAHHAAATGLHGQNRLRWRVVTATQSGGCRVASRSVPFVTHLMDEAALTSGFPVTRHAAGHSLEFGTTGAILTDLTGAHYALTAAHVLESENYRNVGERARTLHSDDGDRVADYWQTIGRIARFGGPDPFDGSSYDVALVRLADFVAAEPAVRVDGGGPRLGGTRLRVNGAQAFEHLAVGQEVCVAGRTTGPMKCGRISALSAAAGVLEDGRRGAEIMLDIPVCGGTSGGPVFTKPRAGAVLLVGIAVESSPSTPDDGCAGTDGAMAAIPIDKAIESLGYPRPLWVDTRG